MPWPPRNMCECDGGVHLGRLVPEGAKTGSLALPERNASTIDLLSQCISTRPPACVTSTL